MRTKLKKDKHFSCFYPNLFLVSISFDQVVCLHAKDYVFSNCSACLLSVLGVSLAVSTRDASTPVQPVRHTAKLTQNGTRSDQIKE